jgi:hypothetical protein
MSARSMSAHVVARLVSLAAGLRAVRIGSSTGIFG